MGVRLATVTFWSLVLSVAVAQETEQLTEPPAQIVLETDGAPEPAIDVQAPGDKTGTQTATSDQDAAPQVQPVNDPMDFAAAQINAGESAEAAAYLAMRVKEIETTEHRYHEDLLVPLTLLGDAKVKQGDYSDALDYYGRARHIARVNHGLFDSRQIPVVYREAATYRAQGNLAQALQREEYAYEVARQDFATYDMQLVAPTARLADFYLTTMNPLAARVMFNRALVIMDANDLGDDVAAVPILTGIADSHLQERFPPIYIASSEDSQLQGPTTNFRRFNSSEAFPSVNTFHAGEEALQRIIEIRQADAENPEAEFAALLRLADWHLLFGRATNAATLYEFTWNRMAETGFDPAKQFEEPKMIYFPVPEDPKAPPPGKRGNRSSGLVTVGFDISAQGRVRNLKTLDSQPPKMMDFRVRRSMRSAMYRPILVEGVPVETADHQFTHRYTYYPKSSEQAPDKTDTIDAENGGNEDSTTPSESADLAEVAQ